MADTKTPIYKQGSKGEEVGKIQTALGDYYTKFGSTVDNDYGTDTAGGVWDWQTQWNKDNPNDQIKVDGIVGPQTYPRLMKWYADKQAAATPAAQQPSVQQPAVDTTNAGTKTEVPAGTGAPVGTPAGETAGGVQPSAVDPNSSAAIQQSQIDAMNKNVDPVTGTPIPTVDKKPDEFPYRFRWDQPGVSLESMLETLTKSKDPTSKRAVIDDYLRYMYDNNLPVDVFTLNDIVNKSHDLSLSPADEEKEKKRIANKERWDKVSNFLLHLGNAIGNVGGGGYASMKLEDPVQWSERQRLLKEKGLEQRRLNNQSIYQQMHKNWADERANRVQQQNYEIKQRDLNLKENTQKHKEYMDEYRIKMGQQKFDWQKEKDKLDRELKEKQISQKDYALRIAALNASVNEYRAYNPVTTTVEKTDSRGRKTIEKRVQSRGDGNGNSGSTGGSNGRSAFGNRGGSKSAFGSRK